MRASRPLLVLALSVLWLASGCPACTGPLDADGGEDGGDSGDPGDGGSGSDGGDAGNPGDGGGTWDGGIPDSLTLDAPLWRSYPRLSPDGASIAFIYRQGGTGLYQLATVNLDGANLRVLVADAGFALASPAWSPNGGTLYWTATDGIRSVPSGGGSPQLVYSYPFNAFFHPDVSPTGDFMVWGVNGASPLRHLDLQSGVVRPFRYEGSRVRVSDDGEYVAFTSGTNVWVASVDGGSGVYAFGGPAISVYDGGYAFASAEWLPGGADLAVATERGLELINIADPAQRTVLLPQQGVTALDVSNDGRLWLYAINGDWPLYFFQP